MLEHIQNNQHVHSQYQINHDNYTNLQSQNEAVQNEQITRLQEKIVDLEKKLSTNQEQTSIQIRMLTESLSKHFKKIKKNKTVKEDGVFLKNIENKISEFENTTVKNSSSINDVDLRLQLHENTIINGHLIWKIDNLQKRRNDAITGKITALHSAPCFTSQYGYKFCLRAYLNGDGMGKASHLSLFLVIM